MNKKNIIIGSAVALIIAFVAAGSLFKNAEESRISVIAENNLETFVRDHSPIYGPKNAKVIITEFLDPECGTCRQFYPFVKSLLKKHDGQVQLVIRYAPFHPNSKFAIRILEAARMQGKYWETLEKLFEMQNEWSGHHNPRPEKVWDYLPGLGIDVAKLKQDMNSEIIEKNLNQDIVDGASIGVRQTPGFFVNGKPLTSFGQRQLSDAVNAAVLR